MTHGPFWKRLVRGTRWVWRAQRYLDALPEDLDATVMALDARDRLHAKQGRSTARVVFHSPAGALPVYLKRHYQSLGETASQPCFGQMATTRPRRRSGPTWSVRGRSESPYPMRSPRASASRPWGELHSYLLVAELTGCEALNEVLPGLAQSLSPAEFGALKRALIAEMADITSRLHRARAFHKDLYLCHFFLDLSRLNEAGPKLTLIDLHRMGEHRWWPDRWRWKDLGQLLYSTHGVAGIDDGDRVRFWTLYRRKLGLRRPRWHRRMVQLKAARYLAHNR